MQSENANLVWDNEEVLYEAPAVVYEGEISTRAGSPVSNPTGDIDLFED